MERRKIILVTFLKGSVLRVVVDGQGFQVAGLVHVVGVVLVVGRVARGQVEAPPVHVGVTLRVLAVLQVVRPSDVEVVKV